MANTHVEYFENVTEGQPVTSENTEFQTFLGVVQTAGTGIQALQGLGCQIQASDPVQGAGWYDQRVFDPDDTGTNRRIIVTLYMRLDDTIDADSLAFAWISEATTDLVPPISALTVDASSNLGGPDLVLDSGSATLPFGGWARVVWGLYEITDSSDVNVVVSIWSGDNLHSNDLTLAQGHLSGVLADAFPKILTECWLVFGRHGDFVAPALGSITLDSVGVDGNPLPPLEIQPEPGFFVVSSSAGDPLPRAEILGVWDGAAYDEVEFLGTWDGTEINPFPAGDLVDTFWLEPWSVDGAVGAPWTVSGGGSPTVTDGVVTGTDPWVISRAGPIGNLQASVRVLVRDAVKFQVRWDTAAGDGLEMADTGGSYSLLVYSGGGVPRALGSVLSTEVGITFTIRLVANRVELEADGVTVISQVLTPTELTDLGINVRVAYDLGLSDGSLELGAIRTENL